jgi:hypothetical protein
MPVERPPPNFSDFARWVAASQDAVPAEREAPEETLTAARQARDQWVLPTRPYAEPTEAEVLQLLAAASTDANSRPPEVMTPRGFRVTLAYEEESSARRSSICVLVRCPPEIIDQVQGKTVYLWSGSTRFELGQFDVDGKAIGTLPAGIEITLSDFARGTVKLEAPNAPESP